MRTVSRLPIAILALAGVAGPAVAQPLRGAPAPDLSNTSAWALAAPDDTVRYGRAGVRLAVTDNVDLFLRGGKDKRLGEPSGRRIEASAGPYQPPKAVKLGVLIRW
jgi:hypothetical protein